jgi:Ca-activated chloride channel family protein
MSASKQDYYQILGLRRDATQEDIKRAYFEAAHKLHPDKNTAAGETELFLDVQQAYETLSNPKRRTQYDSILTPEVKIKLPYEYNLIYSRPSLIHMAEAQMLYVILELEAPPEARHSPAPPLNVCLVLDRSTSMKGEKMDVVKATAVQVMRSLRPQDILSVVAFSDRAEVVIPASFYQDRSRMEAKIHMIHPSGATEIYQGLEAGAKEVMRSLDARRVNHIILLTDGHTYGDEQECLALAAKVSEKGIGISAMGIGQEWNDIFLDVLATRTGGSSAFIAQPQDIKQLLLEKFNALAQIYADEVVLNLAPCEGVDLAYAFRIQPDPSPIALDTPLRLGTILQDASTHILFEYIIQPKAVKSDLTEILNGTLKVAITSQPLPVPPLQLQVSLPVSVPSEEQEPPDERIVQALSRLMLYRMQDRAQEEVRNGRIDSATRHLQNLASNLLSQGERGLAQTILLEVDHLQKHSALTAEGSKKMNYGTRALVNASPKKE